MDVRDLEVGSKFIGKIEFRAAADPSRIINSCEGRFEVVKHSQPSANDPCGNLSWVMVRLPNGQQAWYPHEHVKVVSL